MIEIVVNVLFRLLLLRCFSRRLLLLLGIHLRMIIVIVMIAMHVVRTAVMMSARMDTRMHARHASRSTSTNCIAANHHWIVAAAAACTHHLAIRQKDIDKEDEHEQYVQQADQYHHKLLAAAAVVAHSLLYNRLLHIVGGQHAGLASALHAASHPARVDGFHLKDDIALAKAHLIHILRLVVIDGTINALQADIERISVRCWKGLTQGEHSPVPCCHAIAYPAVHRSWRVAAAAAASAAPADSIAAVSVPAPAPRCSANRRLHSRDLCP